MPQLVMRSVAPVRLGEAEFCCAALANGFQLAAEQRAQYAGDNGQPNIRGTVEA